MVGKKPENSPRVMILINSRTTAMTNKIIPRAEDFQLFKILSFILLVISQINLNFINAFKNLFGVGFDVGPDDVEVPRVICLMQKKVLFEVGNLDIQFGQPDLHMYPDGNDGQQKGKQTDCLGKGQSKYG